MRLCSRNTRLRYASYPFWSGISRTIFAPSSSAVPRCCRASSRSQLRLSGTRFTLGGLLPPLAARSAPPYNFVRHRHCPYGSNRRLTPESLVLRGLSVDRFAQSRPGGLPVCVLASSLLWMLTRLQSARFHARFQPAAQHEGVLGSAPLPCKVRQVSHLCCARCDGKCV